MITKEQLATRTVRELRVLAREWGISVTYSVRKDELIYVLWDHFKQFLPDEEEQTHNEYESSPASVRVWRIRKGAE